MYTNQQRILYARQLKRLHELYVVKSNIHLTYKYKNQNKAIANAQSLQDKIINAIIDDAVYGNRDKIRNIDSTIQELMTTTLENERKRIHHKDDRYVVRAVELNAEKYSQILSNRINREAIKLEQKIESEMRSGLHDGLSEHETRKVLKEKYGNTAKARIKNIIKDSVHTNESNIGWINALNEGYSYKVWMNGQGKGKVRAWHRAKLIAPVPIDEYFDIYGSYHAQAMYPGDLYAGAENVANCRCWLRYTNRRPEGLGEKKTVFNIPQTSYLNPSNNASKNTFGENVKLKPIETIKTTISHTTKKVTSKIKNLGQKLTGKFRQQKVKSKKYNAQKKQQKYSNKKHFNKYNNKVKVDPIGTYTSYSNNAQEKIDGYVNSQKLHSKDKKKLSIWSGTGATIIKAFQLKDLDTLKKELRRKGGFFKNIHDVARIAYQLKRIINKRGNILGENIILFKGIKSKDIDLTKFGVGEVNKFETHMSTSISLDKAKEFAKDLNDNGFAVIPLPEELRNEKKLDR